MNYPNGRSRWLAAGIAALAVSLAPLSQGASLEVAGDEEARLDLFVNSSSPETSPSLGAVQLYGNAQTTTRVLYGAIQGEAARPVDGDEDGELLVSVAANGAASEIVRVTSAGLTVNGAVSASDGFSGDGAGLTGVDADHLGGYAVSDFASSATLGFYALLDSTNQPFTGHVQATEFRIGGNAVLQAPGTQNVMVGAYAGSGSSGSYGTYVGYEAGKYNSGSVATLVGVRAGANNTGSELTAVGACAGYAQTSGARNVYVGNNAGLSNTSGSYNTMLGCWCGGSLNGAHYNTFLGFATGASDVSGHANVYVGQSSGNTCTGGYNTFVGRETDGASAAINYSIAVGQRAKPTANRQVVIGGDDANGYVTDGYIGHGVNSATPTAFTLHATDAASGNTNGADLRFVGGKKAGTGTDGEVVLGYDGTTAVGAVRSTTCMKFDATSTPTAVAGKALIWSQTLGATTEMRVVSV